MRVAIYARVSTDRGEQNPEIQVQALRKYVAQRGHEVAEVFVDHCSGAKADRPALAEMTARIRGPGIDAVAVTKLDRLSRSMHHLLGYSQMLRDHRVELMVSDQDIDTSTPTGRLMFNMLGVMAEFERELIAERTRAGLLHARANGVRLGRPRSPVTQREAEIAMRHAESLSEAARALNIPRSTLRGILARKEA